MLVRGRKIFVSLALDLERPLTHHFMQCRQNDRKWAVASVAAILHINAVGY